MTDLLHHLLTLPTVASAQLSPDGRWVAFEWYRVHENIDVFLAPTDGSTPPIPLTHTPEETGLVSWAPDGQSLVVVEDHDGDERYRLFRIDLNLSAQGRPAPPGMQPLTEAHPPYFLRGGWLSPDGKSLYYAANYDFAAGQAIEASWLYRHDLLSGRRTPLACAARPVYMFNQLSPDGKHLVYSRKDRHPSGWQAYLVDADGQNDREILYFGDQNRVFAKWLPDSRHLAFISDATERSAANGPQHRSVGLYDTHTGRHRWLVDDPQRNPEGVYVSPDGALVVDEILQANHAATMIEAPAGGWDLSQEQAPVERRFTEPPFPPLPGNLRPLGRAADGSWIGLYYSGTSPTDLVRVSLPGGAISSLTRLWERTPLRPEQLYPAEAFHWNSVDGLPVQGWLYRAQPNMGAAVLFIHGGPTYHSEDRLNPQIQYLVSQGFNVLDVNYRGSTGFSLPFREAIKADGWGGREQADIAAGAQALMAAGLAEAGRVGVTGTSYGGYSAWYLITHYPVDVIAAAAPICGMTDLVVDYHTTRPDLRPYSEEMIGGSPEQAPQRYYERSPINFVQDIHGRLLIIQGAQDPNVTPENVRQVRARLEAHGIPYELLVFEDEGHGIHRPPNQAVLFERLAQFFRAALG